MGVVFVQNITMLEMWPPILGWLERTLGTTSYPITFTVTFTAVMAMPILALFAASFFARQTGHQSIVATFTAFGYALIPLDLAAHLAHNMFHLLAEGNSVLYTALAMFGIEVHGSVALMDAPTIQALQYIMVVIGIAGSGYTAYRIARSGSVAGKVWATWTPIAVLIGVLGAINLYLFYLPMGMRM